MSAAPEMPTHGWLLTDESEPAYRYTVAREAQRRWASLSLEERARRLDRVADTVLDRMDDLTALLSEEQGKTEGEALVAEASSIVAHVRWLCAKGPRILADKSLEPGWFVHKKLVERREAYGAVLIIAPWNFPIAIPMIQVVAALLAGNAVVLKPSEYTPRTGDFIAELMQVCDLPPGLLQVVQGDGRVGAALVDAHPDKILFTGSLSTGRKVMAAAAQFPVPVSLELGGIDAVIVREDADLELASSGIAWGATFNSGQVCASVERVLVHESVAEDLVARVKHKMSAIRPTMDLGRVTTDMQKRIYERHVADAKDRGLDILLGGDHLEGGRFEPTLISGEGVTDSAVWNEETFGPIAVVATFRTDEEAARLHDGVPSGLTASIYSKDVRAAEQLARRIRAGGIAINEFGGALFATATVPWGGVGPSGFGRSHGVEGLLDMTWTKVIERSYVGATDIKMPWLHPYGPDQTEVLKAFVETFGGRGRRRIRAARRLGTAAVKLLTRSPRT